MNNDSPRMQEIMRLMRDGERRHAAEIAETLRVGKTQTRLALIALHADGRLRLHREDIGTSTPRHYYIIC